MISEVLERSISLDLLKFKSSLKLKKESEESFVYDPVRKLWVVTGPEEVLRQCIVQYLLQEQHISTKSILVEKQVNSQSFDRLDLAVLGKHGSYQILVECKRWDQKLSYSHLTQLMRYQAELKYRYCWLSNGIENYIWEVDQITGTYIQLKQFPDLRF